MPSAQDKSWVLIWELRELALNGSCREAMLEGGAVSILAALMAEDDLPAPAKANAAAALKVRRLVNADCCVPSWLRNTCNQNRERYVDHSWNAGTSSKQPQAAGFEIV